MASDLIDRDTLAGLKELMGDALQGLLASFEETVVDLVGQVESFQEQGANLEIAKAAHTLKSPSGQLGATKLSSKAAELEIAGKDNDQASLPILVKELREIADSTLAELKTL